MSLSEGEKLRAQRLMLGDRSFEAIAHKIGNGNTADDVRRALRPQIRMRSKLARQRDEALFEDGKPFGRKAAGLDTDPHRLTIPGERLRERDAAMNAPRSLTAELMGDPPPGRSALDKRQLRA